ncbi:MAG: hypothetical protein LAP21_09020 [Acidobacteriia bacterium]|nr:hypothetical protein [Terriglobia bacterium]
MNANERESEPKSKTKIETKIGRKMQRRELFFAFAWGSCLLLLLLIRVDSRSFAANFRSPDHPISSQPDHPISSVPMAAAGNSPFRNCFTLERLVSKFDGSLVSEQGGTRLESRVFGQEAAQYSVFAAGELMSLGQKDQITINIEESAWYALHGKISVKVQKRLVFPNVEP